ncbi:cytochrome c biogenesis protein CcsA [Lentimicrobium sp. L6]|uniref:cytochrome c biogenesis protein CcsA n=1 Tax=Lentimicrobium sp. L6 TaxID=2735916 RepID=UPI001556C693|nr:cytochrome c biogenesis protein CcsA [Lentimicrobium sp. L6]NPD86908.1 cytochrome c biogenesis protein CcsA [Lentimicrobium sp. L6]
MKKLINYVFSMEIAGVLMVVSAFAIGIATFIENDFGTIAAKALVYNSIWFEAIIGLIFINLIFNSIKIKPWQTKQWSVFIFHISFLLIIIGAGLTRYVGYEGTMSIREGSQSNTFLSEHTYVMVKNAQGEVLAKKKVLFSSVSKDEVKVGFDHNDKEYTLHTSDFVPNAMEYIDKSEGGSPMVEISLRKNGKFQNYSVSKGEVLELGRESFGFYSEESQDINIELNDGELQFVANDSVVFFDMLSGQKESLPAGARHAIVLEKLYSLGDFSWVFSEYYPQARLGVTSSNNKSNSLNAIHFSVFSENDEELVSSYALGMAGYAAPKDFRIDGDVVTISYGSELVELPFSIKLIDFHLERYPASNSPSSYSSDVVLIDPSQNIEMDYKIFMNNVLDHRGYRFFQSSYDQDERGTVLSVNHDYAGMIVTYLGYLLMSLGMFFALFAKNSRFRLMMKKTMATSSVLLLFVVIPNWANAQNSEKCIVKDIPTEQVDELSKLLVQGRSGRFQPFNSVSSQVVRKFSRKVTFDGLNTDQILLGMMINPDYWAKQEIIKVSNDQLKKIIGNDASRARFVDFFDANSGGYKLAKYVDAAYQKKPAERGTLDKDVIKVDERVNVFYMAMKMDFLKIFPVPGQANTTWTSPNGPFNQYQAQDSNFVASVTNFYFQSLRAGLESGNYADANLMLQGIRQFQEKYSPTQLADLEKMNLEIKYNKINIFDRLFASYGIFGFIMLVLLFVRVLMPKFQMKWTVHVLAILVLLSFVTHTFGLGMRWYIAGHAPWSNGYESMIFIGWATILAGLVFYKNSPIALAATSVLAALIMYVAHLSWMNPEITNLVPVLKSYWLTIHVAIITASYGFLAMGMFMGFLNLVFLLLMNKSNRLRIQDKINEITKINEMTLIVGIYLLTIGTFLGGVWANESWGRYWGWDPKETWAMVTILVYAFILHMRYVPGLKGVYALNLMTVIGYFSVLMTYFGVNYYLSGLHSYASGDPMPIPNFVYYALGVIFIVSVMAYFKYKKMWSE